MNQPALNLQVNCPLRSNCEAFDFSSSICSTQTLSALPLMNPCLKLRLIMVSVKLLQRLTRRHIALAVTYHASTG